MSRVHRRDGRHHRSRGVKETSAISDDTGDQSQSRAAISTSASSASEDEGGENDVHSEPRRGTPGENFAEEEEEEEIDDDPLLRRVAVMVSASSKMRMRRATRCLRENPDVMRALHAEADGLGEKLFTRGGAGAGTASTASTAGAGTAAGGMGPGARGGSEELDRRVVGVLTFLTDDMRLDQPENVKLILDYPEVLTLDAEEDMRPVVGFLKSPVAQGGAGMSHRAATKTLRAFPSVFARDVATDLRPKLRYLLDVVGVRPVDVAQMLDLDLDTQITPRVRFMSEECGLGAAAAAAVMRRNPRLMYEVSVEETMRPALRCLKGEETTLLSTRDVAHILKKVPNVLFWSPEDVRAKMTFLSETLGTQTAARVLVKYPGLLMLSVENNIAPKFRFLSEELGFGREGARAILTKAPQLIGLDEDNVRPKVNFLVEDLGLSRESAMAMVIRFPPLLTYDLENNLMPTAAFLRDACEEMKRTTVTTTGRSGNGNGNGGGGGGGGEGSRNVNGIEESVDVGTILMRHPSLLAMSVDRKLRPTLTFLRRHYPDCTLSTAMKLCTFSLAGNIMPRVRLLDKHAHANAADDDDDGVRVRGESTTSLRDRWAVATFMGMSVDAFCRKAGVSREEYAAEVASCEADFQNQLEQTADNDSPAAATTAAAGGGGGGGGGRGVGTADVRTPPRMAIRSAIQSQAGGGGTPPGAGAAAAEQRRAARRKKREEEMSARKKNATAND